MPQVKFNFYCKMFKSLKNWMNSRWQTEISVGSKRSLALNKEIRDVCILVCKLVKALMKIKFLSKISRMLHRILDGFEFWTVKNDSASNFLDTHDPPKDIGLIKTWLSRAFKIYHFARAAMKRGKHFLSSQFLTN